MKKKRIKNIGIGLALMLAILGFYCESSNTSNSARACTISLNSENSNHTLGSLVIATSDYTNGEIAYIDLDTKEVITGIQSGLDQDHVLRQIDDCLYVLYRGSANNITALDTNDLSQVLFAQSLGTGANPYDIVRLDENLGLVASYGLAKLQTFSLANGTLGKEIDISSYDTKGGPEAYAFARVNDKIYLGMQVLDDDFTPRSSGKLVKIDPVNHALTDLADIPYQNPQTLSHYNGNLDGNGDKDWLIISATGAYGTYDGAIVAYDINNDSYIRLLEESKISKDIVSQLIVHDDLGIAIVYNADYTQNLIVFDPSPSAGSNTMRILSEVSLMNDMLYRNGKLYIGDREPKTSRIRIFSVDGQTLTEETNEAIPVGLPPYSMLHLPIKLK